MTRTARPIVVTEQAAPATPAAGTVAIYAKSDGIVYQKDDAGVETSLAGGGGTTSSGLSMDDLELLIWMSNTP